MLVWNFIPSGDTLGCGSVAGYRPLIPEEVTADARTGMAVAPEKGAFSFLLYYHSRTTPRTKGGVMRWPFLVLLSLFSIQSYGHGGGQDSYGCHHNRKAGGYHCHRGPNAGQSYGSQADMLRSRSAPEKAAPAPVAPPKQDSRSNSSSGLDAIQGKVVAITDGDTATTQYKIRLAEIDTPERGQPYGARAQEALSALIFGKEVTTRVQDVDRYGRHVAGCTRRAWMSVGRW